jgi:hypothetical protein
MYFERDHLCSKGCLCDTQSIPLGPELLNSVGQCCIVSCCLLKEPTDILPSWRLLHQLQLLLLLCLLQQDIHIIIAGMCHAAWLVAQQRLSWTQQHAL